jgi:hypothetical protein
MNMPQKKYPNKLSDIPKYKQRDIEASLQWFLRFSPADRIRISEKQWEESQQYIKKFSKINQWKQKKKFHFSK